MGFTIRQAQPEDCATIGRFIRLIAEYEKMSDEVVWDDATLYDQLFVERRAEVLLGEEDGQVVGFALYFHNFSTFVGRKGLYLEDLYVLQNAAAATAKRSSNGWRKSPSSAAVAGWNGYASTGTLRRSPFIKIWAQKA